MKGFELRLIWKEDDKILNREILTAKSLSDLLAQFPAVVLNMQKFMLRTRESKIK